MSLKKHFSLLALLALSFAAIAADDPIGYVEPPKKKMGVSADKIQVDKETKTTIVKGNVTGQYDPFSIRGDEFMRDEDGIMTGDDASLTTCTNAVGHTHWDVAGNIEFRQHEYVILRNAVVHWHQIPVLWLPYLYYPLDTDYGLRMAAGYNSKHRAYVQAKYVYALFGDPKAKDGSVFVGASTRVDWWQKNGFGFGQGVHWSLGDFGKGLFKAYYINDNDYDRYFTEHGGEKNRVWESPVKENRYYFDFQHTWQITERDVFRVRGEKMSDSLFRQDFMRQSFTTLKNDFLGYHANTVAWEHHESTVGFGAEVTGALDDFYSMTGRLPEVYVDVVPQPIFDSPFNYESQTKVGYLTRQVAQYGGDPTNPFARQPGIWADYESVRVDTYHRITMPIRLSNDILSIVPRIGYHGTFWDNTGHMENSEDWNSGMSKAKDGSNAIRTIVEAGVTFSARGSGFVDDNWNHMMEPYVDVLAQKAKYSGLKGDDRPYIFDSIDASIMWEDQFAGRGRNLPYTYYGLTPGFRNAWSKLNERGDLRQIVDVDFYVAAQFNKSSRTGNGNKWHDLAEVGDPNYGKDGVTLVPGMRVRYRPVDDISIVSRAEYDSESHRISLADFIFAQKTSPQFSWYINYAVRDFRMWDFSSTPYNPYNMRSDIMNRAYIHTIEVGATHRPLTWLQYSPFIRWDVNERKTERIGGWIDYLTDCLGYRFIVTHTPAWERIDGYTYRKNWNVEFLIYLRAMGADSLMNH